MIIESLLYKALKKHAVFACALGHVCAAEDEDCAVLCDLTVNADILGTCVSYDGICVIAG